MGSPILEYLKYFGVIDLESPILELLILNFNEYPILRTLFSVTIGVLWGGGGLGETSPPAKTEGNPHSGNLKECPQSPFPYYP